MVTAGKKTVLQTSTFQEADAWAAAIEDKLAPLRRKSMVAQGLPDPRSAATAAATTAAAKPKAEPAADTATGGKAKAAASASKNDFETPRKDLGEVPGLDDMNTRYSRPYGYGVDLTGKKNRVRGKSSPTPPNNEAVHDTPLSDP